MRICITKVLALTWILVALQPVMGQDVRFGVGLGSAVYTGNGSFDKGLENPICANIEVDVRPWQQKNFVINASRTEMSCPTTDISYYNSVQNVRIKLFKFGIGYRHKYNQKLEGNLVYQYGEGTFRHRFTNRLNVHGPSYRVTFLPKKEANTLFIYLQTSYDIIRIEDVRAPADYVNYFSNQSYINFSLGFGYRIDFERTSEKSKSQPDH